MRSRASRKSSSDLPLISPKKDSLDKLGTPITRHRRRRRRVDQPSNANHSSTASHARAARPKKPTTSSASSEYPISGFFPRLSRIIEHDEDTASRFSGSPINTAQEPKSRYRRNDAINVDRERTAWSRTFQLQQELSSLSNPSLSSLFSTLTTSSGSSGSSTVTQRSYDRSVGVRRKRRLKHRNRREEIPPEGRDYLKLARGRRSDSMDPMNGEIETIENEPTPRRTSKPPSRASIRTSSSASGGYEEASSIGEARPQSRASSQASSSAGDSHDEEVEDQEDPMSMSRTSSRASYSASDSHTQEPLAKSKPILPSRAKAKTSSADSSSETDEPPPKVASMAAKRRSFPPSPSSGFVGKNVWKRQDTFNSDSGISVSSSPEVNTRPEQVSSTQQSETEEVESDDELSDPSSSDEDEDEESSRPFPIAHSSSSTITNANSQPRALMDNDPLAQRLQEQEEEMRVHMDLHSPQPKRKFRPPVTSPCEPSPALPLFDPRASSTIPTHFVLPPQAPDLPHRNAGYLHPQYPQAIPPPPPFHPDPSRKTVAGYELLAEKLAEQSQENEEGEETWTPVYRKFAQLNHRILLHLQDEISVLEEELRIVDECITQRTEMMEGEIPPASRRMEMRYGNEPHHRRTELLGRIFQKLGQYSMFPLLLPGCSPSAFQLTCHIRSSTCLVRLGIKELLTSSECRCLSISCLDG